MYKRQVVTPIEEKNCQARLREILDIQLGNKRSVWDMQGDGTYLKRQPDKGDDPRTVQEILIELAQKRLASSPIPKKKKLKKPPKAGKRKRN